MERVRDLEPGRIWKARGLWLEIGQLVVVDSKGARTVSSNLLGSIPARLRRVELLVSWPLCVPGLIFSEKKEAA